MAFLNNGALYISGRAKKGKQVVININVTRLVQRGIHLESLIETSVYFFDWVIRNMMVKAHVE